jgi:hypothetical protein
MLPSAAGDGLLMMRTHGILHPAIGITRVLHGHVPVSVSQLCSGGGRHGHRLALGLRVSARRSLILVEGEAGGSVSLRVAVVVARDRRMGRRGVAVVSSS